MFLLMALAIPNSLDSAAALKFKTLALRGLYIFSAKPCALTTLRDAQPQMPIERRSVAVLRIPEAAQYYQRWHSANQRGGAFFFRYHIRNCLTPTRRHPRQTLPRGV